MEEITINYEIKRHHRDIPDELLLEDMRRAARKLLKDTLINKEYETEGTYSPTTISQRFGGWNAALKKAGLRVTRPRCISDTELFDNLKNVWDSLGRQPKGYEIKKPLSLYTVNVYANRFGSWLRALYAFQSYIKNGPLPSGEAALRWSSPAGGGRYSNEGEFPVNSSVPVKNKQRQISKGMRFDVLKRDNYKCRICGRSPATHPGLILHVDHVEPYSKTGKTTIEELQTLCMDCNVGKGTKAMNISSPSVSLS